MHQKHPSNVHAPSVQTTMQLNRILRPNVMLGNKPVAAGLEMSTNFGSHSANVITDSRLAVILLLPVHSLPFCVRSERFSIRSQNTGNSPDYAQLSYGCGSVMIS